MPQSERVLEVQDGKDEAHKLAESHNKCDGEGGALCGEDEDASDAHIPEGVGLRWFSVDYRRDQQGEPSAVVLGLNVHLLRTRKHGDRLWLLLGHPW